MRDEIAYALEVYESHPSAANHGKLTRAINAALAGWLTKLQGTGIHGPVAVAREIGGRKPEPEPEPKRRAFSSAFGKGFA